MTDVRTRISQLMDMETAPLLYTTIRNMESEQLLGVADRTLRQLVVPSLPMDADQWYDGKVPTGLAVTSDSIRGNTTTLRRCLGQSAREAHRERASEAADGTVTLLNRSVDVAGPDGVGWFGDAVTEPPALWALQFHGFEFLSSAYLGYDDPAECPGAVEAFAGWLDNWYETDETRIGAEGYLRRAWTPHAVSLRILHLARFCAWARSDTRLEALAATLVYRNAAFLSNHVERDVGGNHLIENGAALVIAGALFDERGEQWRRQGIDVLAEASAQFLEDGGHFELSSMYHLIALTRYLTAIDLLRRDGREIPPELRETAIAGTRFLRELRPPDGRIPLLNDAVFGTALELDAVLRYADAVGVDTAATATDSMEPSGYYWLGEGMDRLLADAGRSGPAHLPGHSHNDQLSICFWASGTRVLTDTGTYEYAPTQKRQYARSVAAHNTIQYDDVEPIPISGSYLMGRRVDPTASAAVVDGVRLFDGSYSRTEGRKTLYRHRRRIYHDEDWWLVWDTVDADAAAQVTSRLHVAPDIDVTAVTDSGQSRFELARSGDTVPLATVVPLGAERATVATSQYFPEFQQADTRRKISLQSEGDAVQLGFLLSTERQGAVAVEYDGSAVTGVSIDGHYRSLPSIE